MGLYAQIKRAKDKNELVWISDKEKDEERWNVFI